MMNRMNMDEFGAAVEERIKDFLPAEYKDAEIEVSLYPKNGGELHGMRIRKRDMNISPVIYLEKMYEWYNTRHASLEETLTTFAGIYLQALEESKFNIADVMERLSNVLETVTMRLVNTRRSKELLEQAPHREFLDLSIVYRVVVDDMMGDAGSITLTNSLCSHFGISEEQLYEAALRNTLDAGIMVRSISPIGINPNNLYHDFSEGKKVKQLQSLYCVTNSSMWYGAVAIANPEILSTIASGLQLEGFYVLPSSVHEFLIPTGCDDCAENLLEIVRDANQELVSDEEILSNSVYYFDAKKKELSIAATVKECAVTNA